MSSFTVRSRHISAWLSIKSKEMTTIFAKGFLLYDARNLPIKVMQNETEK